MNDLWRTPPEVFNNFDVKYHFVCDVAASDTNHLCDKYFTESNSALDVTWRESANSGDFVFCNPPYSNPLPWVEKCIFEAKINGIGSVILLNHDMSTRWAQKLLNQECKVIVFTGKRIAFLNGEGEPVKGNSKGQVAFVLPPFMDHGKPLTEYVTLESVMEFGAFVMAKKLKEVA